MNILILSGNHKMNKEWSLDVGRELTNLFKKVKVVEYSHWDEEDGLIDLDIEAEKIKEIVEGWNEYIVFAKSAGTVLTAKCISGGILSPKRGIFVGFPYNWAEGQGHPLDEWMEDVKIPILFIHKPHDWVMEFEDLVNKIGEYGNKSFEVDKYIREGEPENDHHYADVKYVAELVKKFLDEG
jgi:hypothetical protein